ncbi:MAG: DMT family transporter [Bacteroidales bacterium]
MLKKNSNIVAHLCMAVTVILFSIISPIGKLVMDYVHPLTLNLCRLFGAALFFWITSIFVKEQVPKKDLFKLFFAAVFGTMLNQGLFIIGLSKTNPIHASLITSIAPILTLIFATFYLKEKITFNKVSGILIGTTGAAILILMNVEKGNYPTSILGDILCLCAQLSYAIYLTVFLKLVKKYSPITVCKWIFTYAFICYFPISYPHIVQDNLFQLPLDVWIRIFIIAIPSTYVTFLLTMTAQKTLSPTTISTYNYFLPLSGVTISVILGLGTINYFTIIAAILIFTGVIIVNKSKKNRTILK